VGDLERNYSMIYPELPLSGEEWAIIRRNAAAYSRPSGRRGLRRCASQLKGRVLFTDDLEQQLFPGGRGAAALGFRQDGGWFPGAAVVAWPGP
jgi:hypothetical protein